MEPKQLIERLVESVADVASHAEIFAVRQHTIDELERRAKRLLGVAGNCCNVSYERGDWVRQADRTLVRLPSGGRAVVHHASGAMRLVTGLAPMERLFEKADSRENLTRLAETVTARLRLDEWTGPRDTLRFERLWQIKAAAADRQRTLDPVLCRVVGAYRHVVGRLPVWGAASVAVKIASGGALDSVAVHMRSVSGEPIDWATVVRPEDAARQVVAQLEGLAGQTKVPIAERVARTAMHIGYLNLGKRAAQRVLAPHYLAFIEIDGEDPQAYQFVVPATDKIYMPLCQAGHHPPAANLVRSTTMNKAACA